MKIKMSKDQEQQYLNLLNEAKDLLNNKKDLEGYKAKMQEIEKFENDTEELNKAQANLNAKFKDNGAGTDISKLSNDVKAVKVIESISNSDEENSEEAKEPKEYVNAWAKNMLGLNMNNSESNAFKMVNDAFTHTTGNTGIVIPETVMSGIWKEVGEQYPLWNDVFKTTIKGKVTLLKSTGSSDAKWYDEETEIEDGKEEFGSASLDGCELSRDITVSWKLREMAIEEFIPFIQAQLVERIGAALGYAVSQGKGKPGESDTFKAEPKGIIPTLTGEEDTPQVVKFTDAEPLEYTHFTSAMSKIKGTYKNKTCIYANGTTIWNEIANVKDTTGRPYFVANPIEGGVGTIFGKVVKEDDGIPDNNILLGDAWNGYHANINKQVSLDSEDHKKERTTDYIAYGIVDGGVRTTKAFSLIMKG
ncbi:phage major capsid protein [Clostridium sp. BL-8]|uniref:phage major capsid protein n=1 Tax=Clostridium sp. BL-8 TaxID=349938 RepID=UPI00098C1AF3|nr:phage major capsid protein [Clostridium sp. BL-8]OOM75495.1 phage capsid family protein [Clostridium sp. BL-8]